MLAALLAGCDAAAPPAGNGAGTDADAGPPTTGPSHDRIFVSQAGSATIVAIDGDSGAIEGHIEVGMLPHNLVLSPDRRTLYAAVVGSQAVAEIDVATLRLRRTMRTAPVPTTRPDGTVIQPHTDQDAFSHTTCYDCHRPGAARPTYAGSRPFGLLVSPDGSQLMVSHLRTTDIAVIDLASGQLARTIALAPAGPATEVVALTRIDDAIWVALRPPQPSTLAGAVRCLDAATLAPRGDVPTGADPAALLAMPGRRSMLVSNFESNTVTELAAGAATAHDAAPGPLGLTALSPGTVLALDYYSNAVSVIDLAAGTSDTTHLSFGDVQYANPTQAAVASDGRSVWIVTGAPDGHLLQLELPSMQVVRDIAIDGLSFGIAIVPGGIVNPSVVRISP